MISSSDIDLTDNRDFSKDPLTTKRSRNIFDAESSYERLPWKRDRERVIKYVQSVYDRNLQRWSITRTYNSDEVPVTTTTFFTGVYNDTITTTTSTSYGFNLYSNNYGMIACDNPKYIYNIGSYYTVDIFGIKHYISITPEKRKPATFKSKNFLDDYKYPEVIRTPKELKTRPSLRDPYNMFYFPLIDLHYDLTPYYREGIPWLDTRGNMKRVGNRVSERGVALYY